ncbi:hypothetical protein STENM223S_01328 [Streptomyces tendae]
MKPIDPRLLRYARATRGFLAAVVGLGAVGAGLVVAQAMLIAEIVVGSFQDGRSVGDLRTPLLLLVAVAAGRGLVGWLTELAAHRASAAVKSELRGRLLDRATALGPGWLGGRSTGSLVTLATRGVDALDGYFSRYLPQLGLAVVVPAAVLARIVAALAVVVLTPLATFEAVLGLPLARAPPAERVRRSAEARVPRCWTPRRPCVSRRHSRQAPVSPGPAHPQGTSPPVTPGRTGTRSPAWT